MFDSIKKWAIPAIVAGGPLLAFSLTTGLHPVHPLATTLALAALILFASRTYPGAVARGVEVLSTNTARYVAVFTCFLCVLNWTLGIPDLLSYAAKQAENQAGSYGEFANLFVQIIAAAISLFFDYLILTWAIRQTKETERQSESAINENVSGFLDFVSDKTLPNGRTFDVNPNTGRTISAKLLVQLRRRKNMTPPVLAELLYVLQQHYALSPVHISGIAGQNNTERYARPEILYWADPDSSTIVQLVNLGEGRFVQALDGLSVEGEIIDEVDFHRAEFRNFSFKRASMKRVGLLRATFINVCFDGADLTNADINITAEELQVAEVEAKECDESLCITGIEPKFDSKCTFIGATMSNDLHELLVGLFGAESPALSGIKVG